MDSSSADGRSIHAVMGVCIGAVTDDAKTGIASVREASMRGFFVFC